MGDPCFRNRKGSRKKVANIGNFVRLVILNGEIPPPPKDKKDRDFFKSRGLCFLNDEFEKMIFNVFLKCIQTDNNGFLKLNYELLKAYSEAFEIEFIEISDIMSVVLQSANKALMDKSS